MRLGKLSAWCVLLCAGCTLTALAQPQGNPQNSHPPVTRAKATAGPRLLDKDEGLAILGATLQTRNPAHPAEPRSDCSHLVHSIYERAGFPYTYLSSSDLYLGSDDFRRVAQPQAGDLVVWRGHAGIVVNPKQHTFFSALRSGFGVQPYDSAYWMARGHPHFLRYLRRSPASVLAASSRSASLKPTGMHTTPSPSISPAIVTTASTEKEFDDDSILSPPVTPAASIPRQVVLTTIQPRADQLREALLGVFRDTADALEGKDVFQLSALLICFDEFKIGKIQRKGDLGTVELEIVAPDPITGKLARGKKLSARQHWSLFRKDAETWELVLPEDAIYLPRALAVRVLAHQLAALSEDASNLNSDHEKQAQLARWLDLLLDDDRLR